MGKFEIHVKNDQGKRLWQTAGLEENEARPCSTEETDSLLKLLITWKLISPEQQDYQKAVIKRIDGSRDCLVTLFNDQDEEEA